MKQSNDNKRNEARASPNNARNGSLLFGENSTDESILELETSFDGGTGQNGIMFDVSTSSRHNIEIRSMDIHTNLLSTNCSVVVYGKSGTHVGFEKNISAWDILFNSTIECNGFGARSTIDSLKAISLKANTQYAFYVYMPVLGVRYMTGRQQVGEISASDGYLMIHEGTGLPGHFAESEFSLLRPRVWNGVMRYILVDGSSNQIVDGPTTDGCRSGLETPTAFEESTDIGSYGNMFDILTYSTAITLTGFEFYTDLTEPVTYEIYTRVGGYRQGIVVARQQERDELPVPLVTLTNETVEEMNNFTIATNQSQIVEASLQTLSNRTSRQSTDITILRHEQLVALNWTLVGRGTIHGAGPGIGTQVSRFAPLFIPMNTTRGIYITLTRPEMRQSNDTMVGDFQNATVGDTSFSNNDLEIQLGVGVDSYPAEGRSLVGPRAWNGKLDYIADRACPSEEPTIMPSLSPSFLPSLEPSFLPTRTPSLVPSFIPSTVPSTSPSLEPSLWPTREPPEYGECNGNSTLGTGFDGGTGAYGNMFTLLSHVPLTITTLDLHIDLVDSLQIFVYSKLGGFQGFESDPSAWRRVSFSTLSGTAGLMRPTQIPEKDFRSVHMERNEFRSFYVTLSTPDIRYTRTNVALGDPIVQDERMSIHAGLGIASPTFTSPIKKYEPRSFNGVVHYKHAIDCSNSVETAFVFDFQVDFSQPIEPSVVVRDVGNDIRETVEIGLIIDSTLKIFADKHRLQVTNATTRIYRDATCVPQATNADGEEAVGASCYPLSCSIYFTHDDTLRSGDVQYAMLEYSEVLLNQLNLLGKYTSNYNGPLPVETEILFSFRGDFDNNNGTLSKDERDYFETISLGYLRDNVETPGVGVLGVSIVPEPGASDNDQRRLAESTPAHISATVTGATSTPNGVDFGELVRETVDSNNGMDFVEELRNGRPDVPRDEEEGADLFRRIESVEAETVSMSLGFRGIASRPTSGDGGSSSKIVVISLVTTFSVLFVVLSVVLIHYSRRRRARRERKGLDEIVTYNDSILSGINHRRASTKKNSRRAFAGCQPGFDSQYFDYNYSINDDLGLQ